MTSFLGNAMSGEACLCYETGLIPSDETGGLGDALIRGFEMLFGEMVSVGMNVAWYPPDATDGRRPSTVSRSFCLTAADLQPASGLRADLVALRAQGDVYRYMFREYDSDRMVDVVDAAKAARHCSLGFDSVVSPGGWRG